MIEKALFTRITSDSTIAALMGLRLFPNKIPQGQPLPAAEYKQKAGKRQQSMSGPLGMVDSQYTITCYGVNYSVAKELSEAVRKRLDGFRGIVEGITIDLIILIDELDVPEFKPGTDILNRYGKELTFVVWFKESLT
jgi:hypothetical protein